jgi:hypothetical protein
LFTFRSRTNSPVFFNELNSFRVSPIRNQTECNPCPYDSRRKRNWLEIYQTREKTRTGEEEENRCCKEEEEGSQEEKAHAKKSEEKSGR